MNAARWLALPLAALTGCTTAVSSGPRLLSPDLHVGVLEQRTAFELDDRSGAPVADEDPPRAAIDTPKKQRRRRGLFFLGIGAVGVGVLGVTGFGIAGRVIQERVHDGYDEGSLSRDDVDRLDSNGDLMNGLAIGSAALGIAGIILGAVTYGIDHARCGDLPPRRKECGEPEDEQGLAEHP